MAASNAATTKPGTLALRAVVTGGTGAIGKHLVAELLAHPERWTRVTTVGRRPITQDTLPAGYNVNIEEAQQTGRLVQFTNVDFESLKEHPEYFKDTDASFCVLGTTRKDAGSAEAFRRVDFGFVSNIARASKDASIPYFSHVTSMNAKKSSWFLYPKTKGEIEEAIQNFHIPHTSIFRPGLLGRGGDARFVEKLAGFIMPSIPVGTVAKAMRMDAELSFSKQNDQRGTSIGAKSISSGEIDVEPVFYYDNKCIHKLAGDEA